MHIQHENIHVEGWLEKADTGASTDIGKSMRGQCLGIFVRHRATYSAIPSEYLVRTIERSGVASWTDWFRKGIEISCLILWKRCRQSHGELTRARVDFAKPWGKGRGDTSPGKRPTITKPSGPRLKRQLSLPDGDRLLKRRDDFPRGRSPLGRALHYKQDDIVVYLLELGAEATPQELISLGKLEGVKRLVQDDPEFVNRREERGDLADPPLIWALRTGQR